MRAVRADDAIESEPEESVVMRGYCYRQPLCVSSPSMPAKPRQGEWYDRDLRQMNDYGIEHVTPCVRARVRVSGRSST